MRAQKLFWILMLVGIVLVCSSWVLDAEADDTYNFYFQKAPGANAVTQSSAGQTVNTATPTGTAASALPAPTPTPPAAQVIVAQEAAPKPSFHKWELGFGYTDFANKKFIANGEFVFDNGNLAVASSGQFFLNVQMNSTENLGVEAAIYYLNEKDHRLSYQFKAYNGRRTDFSGGLVVTPFRIPIFSSVALSLSGIGGVMTLPRVAVGANYKEISHISTYYYGARASLETGRLALQSSARGIGGSSGVLISGALAYLF